MKHINLKFFDIRFLKFLMVGGINALFGYLTYALLIFLSFHYVLAALLSTVLGVLFNFNTTGRLVFKSRDNKLLFKFVGVYLIILPLNIFALKIHYNLCLVRLINLQKNLGQGGKDKFVHTRAEFVNLCDTEEKFDLLLKKGRQK